MLLYSKNHLKTGLDSLKTVLAVISQTWLLTASTSLLKQLP